MEGDDPESAIAFMVKYYEYRLTTNCVGSSGAGSLGVVW